jgi:hypothetical protein
LLRGIERGARLGDHPDAERPEHVADPLRDRLCEVGILVPDQGGAVVARPDLRGLARADPERTRWRSLLAVSAVGLADRGRLRFSRILQVPG